MVAASVLLSAKEAHVFGRMSEVYSTLGAVR